MSTEIPAQIVEAARSIDPRTATLKWRYGDILDPYNQAVDRDYETNFGRLYYLVDPDDRVWVEVGDVRCLHPDVSDQEWHQLMREAAGRDESFDRFPIFHAYR